MHGLLVFAGDAAAVKSYVLRSLLPEAMRTAFVMPASPEPAPAFELLVMSIITLAGGSISEGEHVPCNRHAFFDYQKC